MSIISNLITLFCNKIPHSILLSLLICGLASVSLAQDAIHELRGRVTTSDGITPSTPVRIQLLAQGALQAQTFTDSSGAYTLRVKSGNYQLVVEGDKRTFETTTTDIEIFFSSNRIPQIVTRNITLIPKAGTNNSLSNKEKEFDASIPKEAKKTFEKGVKSLKKGNNAEAVELFNKAIQEHPNYYQAHLALGEEYARVKNFDAARSAFAKASDSRPKAAQPHISLGVILVKNGQHKEAVDQLKQAIDLGDKGVNTYLFLGLALMETDANEEAEKMLLKAQDIAGGLQPGIRLYLANFYNRTGDKKKTLEQLEAYVREAPNANNISEIQNLIKILHQK